MIHKEFPMSVLDRSALSDSPLADLHAIASELSIDGYRRLRRPELIDAILTRQGSEDAGSADDGLAVDGAATADAATADAATADAEAEESSSRRRRGRRGGRGRAAQDDGGDKAGDEAPDDRAAATEASAAESAVAESAVAKSKDAESKDAESTDGESTDGESTKAEPAADRPRRRRGGKSPEKTTERQPSPAAAEADTPGGHESDTVEGVVELLANGSGFVRVNGSDASDDDVYISAAQVKRCELVTGDRVSGPKRTPRRSERYPSMIRIESINGRPASEVADNVRFDDLPATLPTERIVIGSDDPTLEAIEWLTPFGRGSRVTIVGGARAGKTEALRRLATALVGSDDLTVLVALAGVRPEEISEYANDPAGAPAAAVSFAVSHDAAAAAVEPVIDQARRLAARGGDAVVLLDTLDGLSPHSARKVMASARNIVDGGSVTVVATANVPLGGETTVIALDAALTGAGRFPALDLLASGTLKPELLVGDAGAEAIAKTRAEVMNGEDADED
jgi:transcription termination factor Rho